MTDTTETTQTETTQTQSTGALDAALSGVPKAGLSGTTETTTTTEPGKETPKLYAGKFKSVEDMEKGYLEADKLISKGIDRAPENYDTAELEKLNLGFYDDQHRDTTMAALKSAGMSQKTLNAVAPMLAEAFDRHDAARDQIILSSIQSNFGVVPTEDYLNKQIASLKSEWGDDFDAKSKVANALLPELPERIRAVANWDAEVFKFVYGLAVEKRGPELVKESDPVDIGSRVAELQSLTSNPAYYKSGSEGDQLRKRAAELSATIAKQN